MICVVENREQVDDDDVVRKGRREDRIAVRQACKRKGGGKA